MARINPFRPTSPVHPGMFVGRLEEVEKLVQYLRQTRAKQPVNFIISGERGIGKTSLMNYLKWTAEGSIPDGRTEFKFLVIDTDIDDDTTRLGLIKKIELGLRNALSQTERARALLSNAWGFLQRFEAGGVKLGPCAPAEEETLFDEFTFALAATAERVCNANESQALFNATYDGILILIDEADKSSSSLKLGSFAKLFLERLNRRGCHTVMLGLVGLESIHESLRKSHPSSLRLFDTITLNRLSNDEVGRVIDMCMTLANEKNTEKTSITEEGRHLLINLSEGYPHFIQQYGYSAFEADSDNSIDQLDVTGGALGEDGAIAQIGNRYYRDDFYKRIQKESYRQVLRIMAKRLDEWIPKADIRKQYKGKSSVLANALKALRDRHIIDSKEGERGVYRLRHKGFALWIMQFTTDPQKLQKSADPTPSAPSVTETVK